ncbi:DUF952 domain-containing protein [soil metagenome]
MSDQPPLPLETVPLETVASKTVASKTVAFKIVDASEWALAVAAGSYAGSAVDLKDGFIHLSSEDQLSETASKHYAGRTGLLLLTVDLTAVGPSVVWEPSRGGALFPHIYGPMPIDAVVATQPFQVGTGSSVL